jgi:hypothetical protein
VLGKRLSFPKQDQVASGLPSLPQWRGVGGEATLGDDKLACGIDIADKGTEGYLPGQLPYDRIHGVLLTMRERRDSFRRAEHVFQEQQQQQ